MNKTGNMIEHLNELEKHWDTPGGWPFYPVECGFPVLDDALGGFKDGLYLFAGGAGVGKTSFVTQLLFGLLEKNPNLHAILISMDQAYLDIVARFFSLCADLPVDLIRNPRKIKVREELEKRQKGFEILENLKSRLSILDQALMTCSLNGLEEQLAEWRKENPEEALLVVLDPVLSLRIKGTETGFHQTEFLMAELKRMARAYKAGMILSSFLEHGSRKNRPVLEELEKWPGLLYEADFVGLLYNDSLNHFETPFLEWEWGSEDTMIPIVELNVLKNKNNTVLGRLFYRFFNSVTRYTECSRSENAHWNEMLGNLDHFGADPQKRKSALKKKVYEAPKRKEYEGIY